MKNTIYALIAVTLMVSLSFLPVIQGETEKKITREMTVEICTPNSVESLTEELPSDVIERLSVLQSQDDIDGSQRLQDRELRNICCIVFGFGKGFRVTPFTGLVSWFGGELTGSEFIQNHPLFEFAITGILGGCGAFAMFRPRIGAPLSAFVVLDGALGTIGLLGITEDIAVNNWGHPNPSGFVIIGFLGIWISILTPKLVPYTCFAGIALAVI